MLYFIFIASPLICFLFVPKVTKHGVMCLSCVMIKDSALGQQVFFLPLDAELLTHVNPKALENHGRTEDTFLFCAIETP